MKRILPFTLLLAGFSNAANLSDYYNWAIEASPDQTNALISIEQLQQQINEARSVLYPTINTSAGLSHVDMSNSDGSSSNYSTQVSVSQNIYSKTAFLTYDSYLLNQQSAQHRLTSIEQSTRLQLVNAYIPWLKAQNDLKLAEKEKKPSASSYNKPNNVMNWD